MGFTESLVKVLFWSRVRKARKIGAAAELIGQGRAEETLTILAQMERRIPPYLGHLFFLTRGRAHDELGQTEEAEPSYLAAVFAKEGATIAHIHLAILCGRQRRFQEARDWLRRLSEDEEAEATLVEQAEELGRLLDDVESGRRCDELRQRAQQFAQNQGLDDLPPAAALERLDQWVESSPESATIDCDELACYLGEVVVEAFDGQWEVSLNLEESLVTGPAEAFAPFEVVRRRLEGQATLAALVPLKTS